MTTALDTEQLGSCYQEQVAIGFIWPTGHSARPQSRIFLCTPMGFLSHLSPIGDLLYWENSKFPAEKGVFTVYLLIVWSVLSCSFAMPGNTSKGHYQLFLGP